MKMELYKNDKIKRTKNHTLIYMSSRFGAECAVCSDIFE